MERIDYSNHESKCRLCFKQFGSDEHRMQITKPVEKRFRELTNLDVNKNENCLKNCINNCLFQLKVLDGLSRKICVVCNFQLKEFCNFKRTIVDSQKGLLKFFARSRKFKQEKSEINIKTELDDSVIKFEPEVIVEPQSEFLDFSRELNFGEFSGIILNDFVNGTKFSAFQTHIKKTAKKVWKMTNRGFFSSFLKVLRLINGTALNVTPR